MDNYLLSICIPTANRKIELNKQLLAIQSQVKKIDSGLVEVVIGDNTNHKDHFIDLKVFQNLNIKYIKNDGDIGYAKNINSILKNSNGKYCWLLSDDDYIFDNALEVVIDNLTKQINANYITFECGGTYGGKLFKDKMYFKGIKQTTYFKNGNDFLEKYWISIIFISINIFNRERVISHIDKYKLFDDINEVYQNSLIGITFVAKNGGVLVIDKTLLNDNYGNKVYAPENINNAAVVSYHKLLIQLMSFNISKRLLNEMSRELLGNVVNYGFFSIVHNIEHNEVRSYSEIYKNIYKDKSITTRLRLASIVIYILLISNKYVAKMGLKSILLLRRNTNYKKIKKEVNDTIKFGKSNHTSTY
jgi:abequosyltransferase